MHSRGFLKDDSEWYLAFQEAVSTHNTPKMLRKLFVACCIFGSGALKIFDEFNSQMSADVIKRGHVFHGSNEEKAQFCKQRLLLDLHTSLRGHGRTLSDFGLPEYSLDDRKHPAHRGEDALSGFAAESLAGLQGVFP